MGIIVLALFTSNPGELSARIANFNKTTTKTTVTTTPSALLAYDFSILPVSNICSTYADGKTIGPFLNQWAGYGCTTITSVNGNNQLQEKPKAATAANETHSALVTGPNYSGSMTFTTDLKTVKQLRQGSAPNPWEVGWVFWDFKYDANKNTNEYYFIPKATGWELGKGDPSYAGGQRFLATCDVTQKEVCQTFPIGGTYTVKVQQTVNAASTKMVVSVNGKIVTSFTDTQKPYSSGKIGFYTEDATVNFDNIAVTQP